MRFSTTPKALKKALTVLKPATDKKRAWSVCARLCAWVSSLRGGESGEGDESNG